MQRVLYSLLVLFILVSCKKSLDVNTAMSDFTDVEINTVQDNNAIYYVLKSKINPNDKVDEYGFVYSYKNNIFKEIFNDSLSILYTFNGKTEQSQDFEDTIYNFGLSLDYSIRPYAKNAGRFTLGKEVNFTPSTTNFQKITAPVYTAGAINPFALSNGLKSIVGGGKGNMFYTIFDGNALTFSEPADTLPVDFANEQGATFTLGDFGYVVGGHLNGVPSDQVYRYDFANNTWSKMNNFSGGARYGAVAAVVNNVAYIGFGAGAGSTKKDWWKYNQGTDSWSEISSMPGEIAGRVSASSFAINNHIYVVGGSTTINNNSSNVLSSNLWQFNTLTQEWKVLPDCPFKSARCFGFSHKGEGYLGFGTIGAYDNIIVGYNEPNEKWFGYYDGAQGALGSSSNAFAFKVNEKYFVANFTNNELVRVK